MSSSHSPKRPAIWWENTIFFCGTHLAAAYGAYHRPPATVPKVILVATVVFWQLASLGYAYACYLKRPDIPYLINLRDVALPLDTTAYILIGLSMRPLVCVSSLL